MTYKIKPTRGHLEVYINEKFYCTADNWQEAESEIMDYFKKGDVDNENQSA